MDRLPRPSLGNRVSSYPRCEHVTLFVVPGVLKFNPFVVPKVKTCNLFVVLELQTCNPFVVPKVHKCEVTPLDITLFYIFLEMEVSVTGSFIHYTYDTNMPWYEWFLLLPGLLMTSSKYILEFLGIFALLILALSNTFQLVIIFFDMTFDSEINCPFLCFQYYAHTRPKII